MEPGGGRGTTGTGRGAAAGRQPGRTSRGSIFPGAVGRLRRGAPPAPGAQGAAAGASAGWAMPAAGWGRAGARAAGPAPRRRPLPGRPPERRSRSRLKPPRC